MRKERWIVCVGTNGYYEVSTLGNVRRIGKTKNLKPEIYGNYKRVYLSCHGTIGKKMFSVHQLVIDSFKGPCPKGCERNHKNLDKLDNRLRNLEYKTHKYNLQHAVLYRRAGHQKINATTASEIRHLWKKGEFTQQELAERFGINQSNISKVVLYQSHCLAD